MIGLFSHRYTLCHFSNSSMTLLPLTWILKIHPYPWLFRCLPSIPYNRIQSLNYNLYLWIAFSCAYLSSYLSPGSPSCDLPQQASHLLAVHKLKHCIHHAKYTTVSTLTICFSSCVSHFGNEITTYRVKPKVLLPPPTAQLWHLITPNWTSEVVPIAYNEVSFVFLQQPLFHQLWTSFLLLPGCYSQYLILYSQYLNLVFNTKYLVRICDFNSFSTTHIDSSYTLTKLG